MSARHAGRTVLIVDDAADTLEVIRRNLERVGFQVHSAGGVREAIELLGDSRVDLVVTDLKMPGASGLALVRHVRENHQDADVLMITGYPSVASAVEAMREGAVDYLSKPFTSTELLEAVDRAVARLDARRALAAGGSGADAAGGIVILEGVLAADHEMIRVLRAARELAPNRTPVLILGEPGTGRGEIAWLLHVLSGERAGRPFLRIASSRMDRISLQSAWGHGGTVLIEDVDRTDQRLQEDLLRIVTADESGQEARIVATSSVDLRLLAERHGIEDVLAARLSAVTLHVPPLRDRRGDLVPLIRHLAERAGRELARPRPAFTEAALAALQCYEWPGNVGELWEVLRLLATTVPGRPVEPADLPERFRPQGASAEPPTRRLSEVEAVYIREVLASLGGNRSRAAEILGIDRKTLREKLRRDDLASG